MAEIERLNPQDAKGAADWDAFVMACPEATFFHRAGWQRLMRSCVLCMTVNRFLFNCYNVLIWLHSWVLLHYRVNE